ncbi:MAG: hypothetical protein ACREEM_08735 [Blastocatellia bacterium]
MWDDWDEARLLAFFKQRPEMRLTKPPRANHIHKAESALSSATGTKTDATSNDWRTPRLYKMEIVPAQSGLPSRSFSHKQTFNVRLSLDLAEMKLGGEGSSEYSVAVTARRVGVERQQELIKDRGVITSNRNLTLDLKWPALPPGTYRISAAVTIRPKHANTESRDEMTASLAGGLYKVY